LCGRMEITSPTRTVAHLESHFHFDSPESVRPPSTYGTPERARTANPETWERNNWVCDAPCDFCVGAKSKSQLTLKAATCKSNCKLDCTVKAGITARKKVRALRHDAYTTGACRGVMYRQCIYCNELYCSCALRCALVGTSLNSLKIMSQRFR
jgi:hypothetical protein